MAIKKTKAIKKQHKNLTASNLQEALWNTISMLKDGSIDAKIANAMAKQSSEICKIEKLKLDQARLLEKVGKTSVQKFLN